MRKKEDYTINEMEEGFALLYKDKFVKYLYPNLEDYLDFEDVERYIEKMEVLNQVEDRFTVVDHMPFEELLCLDASKQYDDSILYTLTSIEASQFVNLYVDNEGEQLPKINCIIPYEDETYGIIYNTCGECFTEQFDCIEKCFLYFDNSEIEINDLTNLKLEEIIDKYNLLNTLKEKSPTLLEKLYITGFNNETMQSLMTNGVSQQKQQLKNLIENIEDIHIHEPKNEINDSLYEHIESLRKLYELLDNLTPVTPEQLQHQIKINEQVEYICENTHLDKTKSEILATLCYDAYLKDDCNTSFEHMTAAMVDIVKLTNTNMNFENVTPSKILDAYYLCDDHKVEEALFTLLLSEKNTEKKSIAERIKTAEDKSKNSENSQEQLHSIKRNDYER